VIITSWEKGISWTGINAIEIKKTTAEISEAGVPFVAI
jgi:hypothetical protein